MVVPEALVIVELPGTSVPLIVTVLFVVIFRCSVTVVPALMVTFSNASAADVPLIVCDTPEKTVIPLFPAVNVPFTVKLPLIVRFLRDVASVAFAVEREILPPTVIIALFDVAANADANAPPIVRSLEMVSALVRVSVVDLKSPEMVKDLTVAVVESEGALEKLMSPIITSLAEVGTPLVQLVAIVQLVLVVPVQDVAVCARMP